jgi:hypothetical protein
MSRIKKDQKETILEYFSKQHSGNMRHFIYLFGLIEFEARDTINNGWEKRLLSNLNRVRLKNKRLYNSIVAVAEKEQIEPDTVNYTYSQDHLTENLKQIQDFEYQQGLGRLIKKLITIEKKEKEGNPITPCVGLICDLSLRTSEHLKKLENPDYRTREDIEMEIRIKEDQIKERYRLIREMELSLSNQRKNNFTILDGSGQT